MERKISKDKIVKLIKNKAMGKLKQTARGRNLLRKAEIARKFSIIRNCAKIRAMQKRGVTSSPGSASFCNDFFADCCGCCQGGVCCTVQPSSMIGTVSNITGDCASCLTNMLVSLGGPDFWFGGHAPLDGCGDRGCNITIRCFNNIYTIGGGDCVRDPTVGVATCFADGDNPNEGTLTISFPGLVPDPTFCNGTYDVVFTGTVP